MSPPAGLVSWWRAEGNANDAGGGFNNGAAYYVGYTAGEVNQAFSFNGGDAVVCVADSPNLRFTTALTLEAWVKPAANAGQAILSKWDVYSGVNQMAYNFYLDSGGHLCLTLSPSGTYSGAIIVSSANALPLGTWTHVAGTFDGTTVTVYTNGIPQVSQTWAGNTIYPGTDALGIGGVVGGGSNGAVGGPFDGAIDEASVYSTCLSASDILAIYNAGSAGKCASSPPCAQPASGLVSWWRAEDDATDYEGLNNGTAYYLAYDTQGEVNLAFAFNGSSANVWVADSPSLHFSTALTLEAWVKPAQSAGQAILSKWDMYNGLYQMSYNFYLDSGNHVCLTLSTLGDYTDVIVVNSTAPVPSGDWTHVAGTFDGQYMRVYINGSLQGSGYWPYTIHQGTNALGIGAVVGGGTPGQPGGGPFYGSIDEASIYSACLSASDILAIANAGSAGKCLGASPFITLSGLNNGGPIGGVVTLPVQVNPPSGNVVCISVDDSGTPVASYLAPFQSPALLQFDTTQLTNGVHNLSAYAMAINPGTGLEDGSQIIYEGESATNSVNVYNEIAFPNYMLTFGELSNSLAFVAQSGHPDAQWELDIYGSAGNYIGSFDGTTTSGFIGVAWNLLDHNGVLQTDSAFQFALSTAYGGPATAPVVAPTIYRIADPWPGPGGWVVANQQAWQNYVGADLLDDAADTFVGLARTLNLAVSPTPQDPSSGQAYRIPFGTGSLNVAPAWTAFRAALYNPTNRNLFYLGHGDATGLGYSTATSMSIPATEIGKTLGTWPAKAWPQKYRFVWLHACSSAAGNLPEAFGIKKQQNVQSEYYMNASLRPCAFAGWNKDQTIGFMHSYILNSQAYFAQDFVAEWEKGYGVKQAFQNASQYLNCPSIKIGQLKVFGFWGLTWNQYNR